MQPFLKWVGGKRWLAQSGLLRSVPKCVRHIEPFVGSGAAYFHLRPSSAILSDLNGDLINLYAIIRDYPDSLMQRLEMYQASHSSEHYYQVRRTSFTCPLERAAKMLYLNRTCWNGLYRVNRLGEFNVPIGTKTKVVMDTDNFPAISTLLQSTTILQSDFEPVGNMAMEDDFMFVDPPYTARHNNNGFLNYNETMFSWDDQERLHAALVRAARRGAKILVTNADHESLRLLYRAPFRYKALGRQSVLAGKKEARSRTTEALFYANLEL